MSLNYVLNGYFRDIVFVVFKLWNKRVSKKGINGQHFDYAQCDNHLIIKSQAERSRSLFMLREPFLDSLFYKSTRFHKGYNIKILRKTPDIWFTTLVRQILTTDKFSNPLNRLYYLKHSFP